jgi:succinate dehydrogenase/fumarate reductase cytochrome b subunit
LSTPSDRTEIVHRPAGLARRLGLVPLAVFLVLHVLETSSAIHGREAFVERAAAVIPAWVRALLVLVPLGVHMRLVFRLPRPGDHRRRPDTGVRSLQLWSGLVLALFLVVHLGHAFVPAMRVDASAVYERLRHDLSQAPYAGLYTLGITAACLHFAQGMESRAGELSRRFGPRAVRSLRALGFASALALFAVAMNTLSHFVVGQPFFLPR